MKASSGRMSQYSILNSEMGLSKHLLETELFSEESLIKFIEKYKSIVIKPVFGPGEINIFFKNNQFNCLSGSSLITFADKEEIFPYLLRNHLKQRYFIIQAKKHSTLLKSPFHYYVTVQRNAATAEWQIVSKTEKYRSLLKQFLYMYFHRKIEKLSTQAAMKLGESFPDCHTIVIDILYDLKGGIWIQDTLLHFSKSKWSQHHILSSSNLLIPHVPDTDILTKFTFSNFLQKYNEIIIKPCIGKEGRDIVQITKNHQFTYDIQSGRTKITIPTLEEAYHYIEEKYPSKKYYLVQQRLSLATVNDCPMDIRVIAQKCGSAWSITGKLVKIAGKGFFITNAAQKLLTLNDAVNASNISHMNHSELESQIDRISINAARNLEENYPDSKIFGFDIGITDQGDIWIIEANFNPNLSMFSMMEDQTIYRNILNAKKYKGIAPPDTINPHEK